MLIPCGTYEEKTDAHIKEIQPATDQITRSFAVSAMTCGHCASAVISELNTINGVTDVHVDLVAGGTSTVTVTSQAALDQLQVVAALAESGDYQLV